MNEESQIKKYSHFLYWLNKIILLILSPILYLLFLAILIVPFVIPALIIKLFLRSDGDEVVVFAVYAAVYAFLIYALGDYWAKLFVFFRETLNWFHGYDFNWQQIKNTSMEDLF